MLRITQVSILLNVKLATSDFFFPQLAQSWQGYTHYYSHHVKTTRFYIVSPACIQTATCINRMKPVILFYFFALYCHSEEVKYLGNFLYQFIARLNYKFSLCSLMAELLSFAECKIFKAMSCFNTCTWHTWAVSFISLLSRKLCCT